jgi:hypothetical protein
MASARRNHSILPGRGSSSIRSARSRRSGSPSHHRRRFLSPSRVKVGVVVNDLPPPRNNIRGAKANS